MENFNGSYFFLSLFKVQKPTGPTYFATIELHFLYLIIF